MRTVQGDRRVLRSSRHGSGGRSAWSRWGCAGGLLGGLFGAVPAAAQSLPERLQDLSLEELSNIEITSVSKRGERLSDAPTSVFVITAADIRRAGATSLPEALRLAPNLQVAQVSGRSYAISARGFNGSSANKLLVLIDGRSVYSPLFSGVFWDVQDPMLEDIERIEVISGPGGTLWGVNAVNGVINIITHSAAKTQGALLAAGAGNREARVALRQGGRLGESGSYRVYASQRDTRHTETDSGAAADDAARNTQLGFRADWDGARDRVMLKGDAYSGVRGQPAPGSIVTGARIELGDISLSGANLFGLWERRLGDGAAFTLQAYYDYTRRVTRPTFSDFQGIADLQAQYAPAPIGAHRLVGGFEYRHGSDRLSNSTYIAFLPERLRQRWISVFAQDEIGLRDDLDLTLGARVERNDYTGNEFLPNARLAWRWAPNQLLWAAAARTVRAPSRLDHDTFVPGQAPFLLRGGPDVKSEVAKDFELGYRGRVAEGVSLSATAFHTDYDDLRTQEVVTSVPYIYFANNMKGRTSGLEMWSSVQPLPGWRLHGGFSRLLMKLERKPGSNDVSAPLAAQGASPGRWWSLRSAHDLTPQSDLDVIVRYVSKLASPEVPAYTALDLRYAWRPMPGTELSVAGQNLLDGSHGEFTSRTTRSEFKPALFVKVECRF